MSVEQKEKLNNPDTIRSILQKANDALHQSVANKDIAIIATQNKADKSKFTIVADSVYEKELEGVQLTFANPQDYLRLFPTEPGNAEPPIKCPPNTEYDPVSKKCVPIAPDSYTVLQIASQPKSQTPQFHEKNVLDGKEDTKWAINQKGASLTLDLGSPVDVGTVWIWWGDGDKRSFYFNIGTSQTEDQDFVNIWTTDKMSSGKINEFEPYNLSKTGQVVKARFIHITINGNSANGDWAAISNIKVTKNVAVESAEQDIVVVTTPPPPPPPVVEPPEVKEPQKPVEGRLQFEKGGNQDANTWKAVEMQKQPELWKIVDDKGINIADQFTKKENCEITIKWYQWNQNQTPVPPIVEPPITPPVTPPIDPSQVPGITKDGVQIPYPITGQIEYTFRHNDRDDGKRMDFNKFKSNTYVNSAVLGYFAFPNGKTPDDEVSGKWSVEGHSDGTDPKCYDLGIKTNGGQSRYRFESPHPKYTSDLGKGKENGVSLGTKFIGYMFIRRNLPNGNVALEIWQDAGNNEGATKPSNQWKQLAYWEDAKYKITNYPNGPQVTIRIDGSNVVKDMSLKYVSCVELKPTTA